MSAVEYLQIQPVASISNLVGGNPEIPLGDRERAVVELQLDELDRHESHASLVAPGLAERVVAVVSFETHFLAYSR